MGETLSTFLEGAGRGIVTVAEARRIGCGPVPLRSLVRQGKVVRVARGVYVLASLLEPPAAEASRGDRPAVAERTHLLVLDALLRGYGRSVAASHQSAALAWSLPVPASSLDRVHLAYASPGRTARRYARFSIHTCELRDVITQHHGRRVVVPALAAVGTALHAGLVAGVVVMDAALRAGHASREELGGLLERMRHTPHLATARAALRLADGLAESPRETRLRIVLVRLGIPFLAQHWIRTGNGRHYRVDFYLPTLGVVLEYDGEGKYADPVAAGLEVGTSQAESSARRALLGEKQREDDLRLDGFGVGRVTSQTLNSRDVVRIIGAAKAQALPRAVQRPAEPPPWAA